MAFRIPDDLTALLTQRRVIPFVGAGFSRNLDIPGWETLLEALAEEIQVGADIEPVLSFKDISDACGGDNLQIAEYLYLIAGESIGPLRHKLSTTLQAKRPVLESTPHIELANLGAPHVYTTNFDDLIERTYRALKLPVDVIAVPRDMALSHADRTQIVKYHGDLRHEKTLVLTESQYYTRLEFESPMDLKFRSDLLGRSVFFMGYSFRDINIRVIWFRLMQMMQDVPVKDRPPSYIARLRSNPVLDSLYEAVGLRTIVMDPDETAATPAAQNKLLADFLMQLSLRCAPDGVIPGSACRAFVSPGLVETASAELPPAEGRPGRVGTRILRRRPVTTDLSPASTPLLASLNRLVSRQIPETVRPALDQFLLDLARRIDVAASQPSLPGEIAEWYSPKGPSSGLSLLVAIGLLSMPARASLLSSPGLDWEAVWSGKLATDDHRNLLRRIEREVGGHEGDEPDYTDEDLAYAIDLAKRLAAGGLGLEENADLRDAAVSLIARATEVYPSVEEYEPRDGQAPNPQVICREIEERANELASREDQDREPFDV